MKKTVTLKVDVDNMDEVKQKAEELVAVLKEAQRLIAQLNEMDIIVIDRNPR